MLTKYLKTAWKNAARNKARSLISLLGLTLGMACVMLIALFIKHEYQVAHQGNWHPKSVVRISEWHRILVF